MVEPSGLLVLLFWDFYLPPIVESVVSRGCSQGEDSVSLYLADSIAIIEVRGEEVLLLTQNVHLAPSTQQAEQAGFTRAENHETCQSIFPEN
jgi:hypothetical protein